MRIVIVLALLVSFQVKSQQVAQYSQWMFNQYALNPAHSGIKSCVDIHSLFRMQWVGFEGAPKSGFLTVAMPIKTRGRRRMPVRHGTGFKFELDRIAQFSVHRFNFSYAAHFNITADRRFSFGLRGGVLQMSYDPSDIHTSSPEPKIQSEATLLAPDATFGAWFNDKNYYIGLVVQNLIPSRWDGIGNTSRNKMHFVINGAYRLKANDKVAIIPGLLMRIPPAGKSSLDINVNIDYNDFLNFGLGFRTSDAIIAMFSVKISNQFSINYSFDYSISDIQNVAQNTHEVSLSFSTCKRKKRITDSCPLFE